MIKKLVIFMLPKSALEKIKRIRKQIKNFAFLAQNYGQWRTVRDWNSVDESGNPIPWYTYPAIEYLSHLHFDNFSVFEYGSGNSTLWWASRAKSVIAVEDDKKWFDKINLQLAKNSVEYHLTTNKNDYVSMALSDIDIFIIDGKYRKECVQHVVKTTRNNGIMLIFDNSDWYPKTIDYLKIKLGWVQIDFHGFGPINNYTWTTSVFINPMRHEELAYKNPLKSKCGLMQVAEGD